jgi:hypothetical protein
MTSEDHARLEACTAEIAEILYRNSNQENLDSLVHDGRKRGQDEMLCGRGL